MFVGSADALAPAHAGGCGRKVAWGFCLHSGKLFAFKDPVGQGGWETAMAWPKKSEVSTEACLQSKSCIQSSELELYACIESSVHA